MPLRFKTSSLVTIAMLFGLSANSVRADNPQTGTKVSTADQIQFQQKSAQAQMQELEERMYRLAELTREAEPDDASFPAQWDPKLGIHVT